MLCLHMLIQNSMFLFPEECKQCAKNSLHTLKNKSHLMSPAIYCYVFSSSVSASSCCVAWCLMDFLCFQWFWKLVLLPVGFPLVEDYPIRVYERDITNCFPLFRYNNNNLQIKTWGLTTKFLQVSAVFIFFHFYSK